MPERVLKLAMPVTSGHLRQRLTNVCARRHRLRKHHLSVSDLKDPTTGVPPIEGGASTPISGNEPSLDCQHRELSNAVADQQCHMGTDQWRTPA